MTISVKIVRVPGAVTELMLDDGATVNDALAAAGISATHGEAMKVAGRDATGNEVLSNGDSIVIAKAAKSA
jgi:uncharacterized Zn ribbon protein